MPIVTIETWPMEKERKKKLAQKITNVFAETGIPAQAVTIVIHDTPKENWATGGEIHSEKFKDMK